MITTVMESTLPLWPRLYDDSNDDIYDVITILTSPATMIAGKDGNSTIKKWKCSVGEDVSQRITVVSVIMICTIVGNLALILALTCKGSRRIKRVNVFLVNLALGDLAVALFTNTTEILFLAFGDWALGSAACKISVYMQIVTLASATFLLTAMSMDRYQVIVKPMQSLARRPRIWMKVGIAWVMAFVFATPQLFIFLQITEEQDGVRRRCCVSKGYTEEWQRKVYLSFLTSYILLIPTAVMIYCYANIIHVIWIRARAEDVKPSGNGTEEGIGAECAGSPRMSVRRGLVTASKRRVITMTLTVVVGFLLCQTPYFLVSLVRVYSDYGIKLPGLLALSENIVLMHSTLNPVLYGLFTLRSYHLSALFHCLTCGDPVVSRAERRLLLQSSCHGLGGKFGGGTSGKSLSSTHHHHNNHNHHHPHTHLQVTASACQKNGCCTDDALSRDGSVRSDITECTNSVRPEVRQRNFFWKKKKKEKTNVPLLLITNKAAIERYQDKATPTEEGKALPNKGGSVPVPERSTSIQWGHNTRCVISKESQGKDHTSLSCSQWTPCHVDTSSDYYSCV